MADTISRQDKNKKLIRFVVFNGIIAALYVVLAYIFAPISYGMIQVRVAEAMTVFPIFSWGHHPGRYVGLPYREPPQSREPRTGRYHIRNARHAYRGHLIKSYRQEEQVARTYPAYSCKRTHRRRISAVPSYGYGYLAGSCNLHALCCRRRSYCYDRLRNRTRCYN